MRHLAAIITKRSAVVLAGLLLLFAANAHSIARPVQARAMGGMEHSVQATGTTCATLCITSSAKRDDPAKHVEEEQDDKSASQQPYYVQFASFATPKKLTPYGMHDARLLRPPDLVTLYANYRF